MVTKVIEYDLAPSFLVYIILIGMGQFYVFACVFGYLTACCGGLLVLAYQMNNRKLIVAFRAAIVIFTIGAFLNKFIDDMIFNDAYPEYLVILKNAGQLIDVN
jgi:hypothetical protein